MLDKQRLNIHLYVTPICNLQCKHCYYDSWPPTKIPDRLLSISEMCSIITSLCDNYAAAFDVEGGEFFLREDIDELFDAVPVQYWNKITVTTNGVASIRINPRYLQRLDEFRVSVEGHTDDLQRDLRGIGLENVLKTCASLQSNGVPITLRVTLHKKNYQQLSEMIECFARLGITRFSMYEFQAVGRGRFHAYEYCLEDSEFEEMLNLLCAIPIAAKLDTLKLSFSARRIPLVVNYKGQLTASGYEITVLSGVPSLTINYNGDIGVCPWNIGHDCIGTLYGADLNSHAGVAKCVAEYLEAGRLYHVCNHCSAIRIRYGRYT